MKTGRFLCRPGGFWVVFLLLSSRRGTRCSEVPTSLFENFGGSGQPLAKLLSLHCFGHRPGALGVLLQAVAQPPKSSNSIFFFGGSGSDPTAFCPVAIVFLRPSTGCSLWGTVRCHPRSGISYAESLSEPSKIFCFQCALELFIFYHESVKITLEVD